MTALLLLASSAIVMAAADSPPAAVADNPAARLPIPDAAGQAKAEKIILDIFGPYAQAKPADRPALAQKMLEQAVATKDDPAARFVLLKRAGELASSGGDIPTALHAAGLTSELYAVDADEARLDALRKCAAVPEGARGVVPAALARADEVARADKADVAARYLSIAEAAARGTKDAALVSRVQVRANEIRAIKQESARAKVAREKLAKNPDDPDANLVVGRFLCLAKEEWDAGLPFLAKAGTPAVRTAAAADLARPAASDKWIAAGDGWWDLAEKEPPAPQAAMRRRAGFWYQKTMDDGQLAGLSRARVEKRLAAIVKTSDVDASVGVVAGASRGRNVLLIRADPKEEPIFRAVSGAGKFRVVSKSETVAALADPNVFVNANVVIFGVNRWRDMAASDMGEGMRAALQRFVKEGGDLVMFEQFEATNMPIIETLFGIKAAGGGGVGAQVEIPALAAKVAAAGYTPDTLKDVRFHNKYTALPENSAVLLRGEKEAVTAVVAPFGRGRVILIGTNFDPNEEHLNEAVLDHIYSYKATRPKGVNQRSMPTRRSSYFSLSFEKNLCYTGGVKVAGSSRSASGNASRVCLPFLCSAFRPLPRRLVPTSFIPAPKEPLFKCGSVSTHSI